MTPTPQITVFYWDGSPWASKVINYLNFRGLPYSVCIQPLTMPRPDLEQLGVKYRRIPLVAIGKDIYIDTLLILQKIEKIFPTGGSRGSLSSKNPEQKALEVLLEKWTDAVVFSKMADCIPLDHPLVQDSAFIKDRTELWGYDRGRDYRSSKRPEGLVHCRESFDMMENTILADGRKWALGTKEPMLADIHSAWIFDWMIGLDSFSDDIISEQIFPKVYSWCKRYNAAVEAAAEAAKPEKIEIGEVLKRLASAEFAEPLKEVDSTDPQRLNQGQHVTISPTDTGFNSKDAGRLLALSKSEAVLGSKTQGGTEIHVHAPRWNFAVKAV